MRARTAFDPKERQISFEVVGPLLLPVLGPARHAGCRRVGVIDRRRLTGVIVERPIIKSSREIRVVQSIVID